ncbi:MAG: dephospho-CoA kinase [Betaproteobacteria bacterium]|nr:dephospho-CoA kinase [Betaproteobacteria bacterium]
MSNFVVGLTGGIGSGKSAAADCFAAHGAAVVDTDAIAHELTAAGGAAMPALRAAFGEAIATPAGALDREQMRRLAFADAGARVRLEGILHPLIRALADERCHLAASPYVILAVPLLVESGAYRERCDRIAVVDCPEDVQIARVMARNGMAAAEVRAIMAAQASRQQRLAAADDVIDNGGRPDELAVRVAGLHRLYLELVGAKLKANC